MAKKSLKSRLLVGCRWCILAHVNRAELEVSMGFQEALEITLAFHTRPERDPVKFIRPAVPSLGASEAYTQRPLLARTAQTGHRARPEVCA